MTAAPCPDFETARLGVSEWSPCLEKPEYRGALTLDLGSILTEPVLRHLPETVQLDGTSADPIADWIELRQRNGFVYAARLRRNQALVGLLTLATPAEDDLRLGYLLGEAHWGRGYATELVAGFLAVMPPRPGRVVHAGVVPANVASARVLVKAGFRHDAALSRPDLDHYCKPA